MKAELFELCLVCTRHSPEPFILAGSDSFDPHCSPRRKVVSVMPCYGGELRSKCQSWGQNGKSVLGFLRSTAPPCPTPGLTVYSSLCLEGSLPHLPGSCTSLLFSQSSVGMSLPQRSLPSPQVGLGLFSSLCFPHIAPGLPPVLCVSPVTPIMSHLSVCPVLPWRPA